MNVGTLSGHLGKDPEIKFVGTKNTPLTTFSLAVSRGFGENKITDWWNIKVWGKPAETVSEYFKKGDKAVFSGDLEIEEWENKEGVKQKSPTMTVRNFDFPVKAKGDTSRPVPQEKMPF